MAARRRRDAARGGGRDLRGRVFAWYWRRRAARSGDPREFLRLLGRRRAELDDAARKVEARLSHDPADDQTGEPAGGAVWTHRPAAFAAPDATRPMMAPVSGAVVGEGVSVFHDAAEGAFILSRRPNRGGGARPRFEIVFESYAFDGSYLSFSIAAPGRLRPPRPDERLTLSLNAVASRPVKSFVRLNIGGAGGDETLYAEGVLGDGAARFDFDLSFAPFAIGEDDSVWFDLILDRPRMLEFTITDLTMVLGASVSS